MRSPHLVYIESLVFAIARVVQTTDLLIGICVHQFPPERRCYESHNRSRWLWLRSSHLECRVGKVSTVYAVCLNYGCPLLMGDISFFFLMIIFNITACWNI